MKTPLRVLIVEDSEDDVALILRELRNGGFAPEHLRVDQAETMRAALLEGDWQIILSDYSMPGFNGRDALQIYVESGCDIPFIMISGAIGEEAAADLMRAGAHDCVLKEKLARLCPAISRELGEVQIRAERQAARETAARLLTENRLMMQQLVSVQEEERRRLARDLHDELGQSLTAIKLEAASIARAQKMPMEQLKASADSIQASTDRIFSIVRGRLKDLPPQTLYTLGLMSALRELTSEWQQRTKIPCSLVVTGPISGLDDATKLTVYRIVQESLTNAAKHAHANHVEISLTHCQSDSNPKADVLELVIADNGIGLGEASTRKDGLGLVGIRERAHMLGGELHLNLGQAPGTQVVVRLPLSDKRQSG